jgi:HrpA-like RNA helicase
MQLLITPYLPAIGKALVKLPAVQISPFPLIEVVSPTGSGKTQGIPNFLLNNSQAKVFVALPTRVSVLNAYQTQVDIVSSTGNGKENLASLIGFAQERNVKYTNRTRLVYATAGHILNKILSLVNNGIFNDWTFCDILFVDEVHAGSIENHMILRLWLLVYQQKKQIPRLLLASATPGRLEREIFGTFLTIPLTIERKYPITDFFHPEQYLLHDPKLYTEAAEIAVQVHFPSSPGSSTGTRGNLIFSNIPGNILIFVPGANESKQVSHRLDELIRQKGIRKLQYFELRSESTQEELKYFLTSSSTNASITDEEQERRIIIATNVAESSITLPDMLFCIDTLTEKRNISNMVGSSKLVLHWISKASSMQRRGRVGRVQAGYYYRMCLESFYNNLEDVKPEEITRASLTTPVMRLLDVGLDPYAILLGAGTTRIANSIDLLTTYGGLEVLNGQLQTTVIGKFAARLGIGFRMARFLWDWWKTGKPVFPAVLLAAIIDSYTRTLFFLPVASREPTGKEEKEGKWKTTEERKAYLTKLAEKTPGLGDIGVYLTLFLNFVVANGGNLEVSRGTSVSFATENSLDHRRFRETWDNMVHLYKSLSEYGREMNLTIGQFDIYNMLSVAVPLLNNIYLDYRMKLGNRGAYSQPNTGFTYTLQNKDSVSKDKPKELISLSISEIVIKEGKVARLITLWVPYVINAPVTANVVETNSLSTVPTVRQGTMPVWANVDDAIEVNLSELVEYE